MARILIIDDTPANRQLLAAYLGDGEHEIIEAETGDEALELARRHPPDLVLCDVMMPGLDGFETTRRLKAEHADEHLPIILVTALGDREHRLAGLAAGADEFLARPIDPAELRVRVSNLLALRRQAQDLLRRNVELVELHRYKEELSQLIVHDLKNPLSVVLSCIDYLQGELAGGRAHAVEALEDAASAARRLTRLLKNLLDISQLETSRFQLQYSRVQVGELVAELVEHRALTARVRGIRLSVDMGQDAAVEADRDLVIRLLENLFDNAFRHTPVGGRIEVGVRLAARSVRIDVANTGSAVPADARSGIFEKYGQVAQGQGRMSSGLGLYFCRLAAEAHGGRMWVEESAAFPTIFALELPLRREG